MDQGPATSSISALRRAPETSQDQQLITGHVGSATVSKPLCAPRQNKGQKCKFFTSKQECRAGDACPFLHDSEVTPATTSQSRASHDTSLPLVTNDGSNLERENRATGQSAELLLALRPLPKTAVLRPIAPQQLTNPREYELTTIRRRFSPTVNEDDDATVLLFKLFPSDPDFPFELADGLQINLSVPKAYPRNGRPSIRVDNKSMERGYQINVEKGFDELVAKYPTKTLLALMNELDKNLENFLISQKARTIKLIPNANKTSARQPEFRPQAQLLNVHPSSTPAPVSVKKKYTTKDIDNARSKREADVRQLENRMRRQPLYSRSDDGSTFNIPLQVPKTGRLPVSLQAIKDIRLGVPSLYPLEPCNIRFREVSKEAWRAELAFARYAEKHPELTLMAHINHLVQNLHLMTQEDDVVVPKEMSQPTTSEPEISKEPDANVSSDQPRLLDEDRPHVQVISRPPEWDMQANDSDEEDSDPTDSEFSGSEMEEDEEAGGVQLMTTDQSTTSGPERGILISFPLLELYSIELLQISSLSLTIKCDRCKDTTDVMAIKPATAEGATSRNVECKRCSAALSVAYRSEPTHMNSVRAGHLDLEGCTVVDMLPSTFQPTCSECSTTFAQPGVVSIRGETSMAICRECHKKMSFTMPEIRFLRVSSAERPNRPLPLKKRKENLGIIAGTELPKKGQCQHYKKSFRWFRFTGCCQRVYPCDRCHDANEEHPHEWASRMLCGLCSREQPYRPEDCAFCRNGLVGKKSGGFWEGGKGTRDKVRMSRKDPRKYKRRGGGAVSAKAK